MNNHINEVIFNLDEMQFLVIGEGIPTQRITITELDEWSSIVDNTGEPVWDIQIWGEDEDEFGCQYCNVINVNGQYHMGSEWYNPTTFDMVDTPIADVTEDIDIETENI